MLKKLFLIALFFGFALPSQSQYMRKMIKRKTSEVGIVSNLGYYGNAHYGGGANILYTWGIGRARSQRFNFGFGLRGNVFFTKKRYYETASLELIALNPGGADSMYFEKVQTSTLNGYFVFHFNIKPGADLFFTTDLGGVNFGGTKDGYFKSYEQILPTTTVTYNTEPYAFNVTTGNPFKHGFGTLMSEAYGSFRLGNFVRWRIGVNMLRNEYQVDRNVPYNGKRFSQTHFMFMTGIGLNIRQNRYQID